ncbi:putative toxin [Rhizobium lentis]|uniref:putative toxin n=1 Tax=Rhizobium lentis TaxID=1138194 RepID=UPI001C83E078
MAGFEFLTGSLDQLFQRSKNVGRLSLTQQLRDYIDIAISRGLRFDLFDRPTTKRSGPLQRTIDEGLINRRDIEQ